MKLHLIFSLLISTFLAIVIMFLIWTQIVPEYQSKAEIRVPPVIPQLVFDTENNGLIPFYNSYLNTQVSIIQSPSVLMRVLDKPEIRNTMWYKNPEQSFMSKLFGKEISPLERLRENLSAAPRSQSEIIDVSFIASDAKEAQLILNCVLDQYLFFTSEISISTENKIYDTLVNQCKTLESEIKGREAVIAQLYKEIGTREPQELITNQRVRMDQTRAKLKNIQQEIAVLKWQLNEPNKISLLEPETNIEKLEFKLAQTQYEEQLLESDMIEQQSVFNELFSVAQIVELENDALNIKRKLYDAVRERLEQKNMERNAPKQIELLCKAFAPSEPYNDNRILFTVITLIMWIFLSSIMIITSRIRSGKANKNK